MRPKFLASIRSIIEPKIILTLGPKTTRLTTIKMTYRGNSHISSPFVGLL